MILTKLLGLATGGHGRGLNKRMPMRNPDRMARTTPTTLNCGGSVTSFAAAEVVASAVAETVLLEVAIGSKQVQAAFGHTDGQTSVLCI